MDLPQLTSVLENTECILREPDSLGSGIDRHFELDIVLWLFLDLRPSPRDYCDRTVECNIADLYDLETPRDPNTHTQKEPLFRDYSDLWTSREISGEGAF